MSKYDRETKGDLFFAERDRELNELVDQRTGKVHSHLTEIVDCPLCSNSRYSVLFTKNGFDFVRCVECSHVYVNPQFEEGKVVSDYDGDLKSNDLGIDFVSSGKQREVRGRLFQDFLDKVQKEIPSGKILDIGCSIGQFLKMAVDRGFEAQGLELNEKAAHFAEENYGVKVHRKLLEECSFKDGSFDVVSMFGVIEHLVHPKQVMEDVFRILRPGGLFIGICPNVQSLVCMILHELSRTFTGRLHLSYFSEKTLRYLFTKVGFINDHIMVDTMYTGMDSMLNYFQFLDPFDDEQYGYLPQKFRNYMLDKRNQIEIEKKMCQLGIGLKLIFTAKKA